MGGRLDTPRLFEAQVLVVAAAGNEGRDPCTWLYDSATTPNKLLVGATTKGGALASFSNYGACVHVQVLNLPPRAHTRSCPPASGHPQPTRPLPHGASPAARVRRPPAPTSWRRGLAQATPPPRPSAAPAWRRRMSRALPPSCSRRIRPSRWRKSRRLSSPRRRWAPSPFLQTQFNCKRPTAFSSAAPDSSYS